MAELHRLTLNSEVRELGDQSHAGRLVEASEERPARLFTSAGNVQVTGVGGSSPLLPNRETWVTGPVRLTLTDARTAEVRVTR